MPRTRKPKYGSMQYWPRKKAGRQYSRVRHWPSSNDVRLLGFAGYKVGMAHIIHTDNRKTSITKNQDIFCPVTIIECPSLKAASIRFYKKTSNGLKLISEIFNDKLDKELKRKIIIPKKINIKFEDVKDYDDVRLLVYTQPKLTSIGKKKPEIFEVAIGGKKEEKLEYTRKVLGNEISLNEVFKAGQQVDVHAVSKGKGLQGPVKRFGIGLKQHKSEKGVRRLGTLGGWKAQGHFMYRVAHAGQMGYHQRIEHNKWILQINNDPKSINLKGGFNHYGLIKNPYILLKGSVIGPSKRLIRFNISFRSNPKIPKEAPQIQYIDLRQ